eukprot:6195088-Pleurochrysis_carterae.AAC.1
MHLRPENASNADVCPVLQIRVVSLLAQVVPHTKVAEAQHPGGEIFSPDHRSRSTGALACTIMRGVEPARYQYQNTLYCPTPARTQRKFLFKVEELPTYLGEHSQVLLARAALARTQDRTMTPASSERAGEKFNPAPTIPP